jgi:hypothetical protein
MLLAAVVTSAPTPTSTVERIREIPPEFWMRLGAGILVIIVLVIVLRKLAKANKVVVSIVVALVVSIVGFNWIYERNEPTWATPAVDFLSGWFPTKGKVEQKKHGV